MTPPLDEIRQTLAAHGQEHLLAYVEELDARRRASLLAQIDAIDFVALDELIATYVRGEAPAEPEGVVEPARCYGRSPDAVAFDPRAVRDAGEALVREGRVAALTVAGGQGTRLGWNGPKGTFPATVVTGKPLFRCFAEQILAAEQKYGVTIPWCIMTSPINDEATRAFFADNNSFGLARKNIFMFPQAVVPSIERETGRLLLADRHEIAVNPDGHGGTLRALHASGALEFLSARGAEHVSYFQVDNPAAKVIDPVFLGLHVAAPDSSGEMSSKMVRKIASDERVGVFARRDGRTVVIEYTELGDRAEERDTDGRLRYDAGNIAIHLVSVDFASRLTADGEFKLPWHRAEKKVPHVDPATGALVEPATANAIKLEAFIFDALPLAGSSIVLETGRAEEFAPIKNAKGSDSPATSHQLQSDRFGRWLEMQNVAIPLTPEGRVDARIEISPLTALEPGDLSGLELPARIEPGEEIVL